MEGLCLLVLIVGVIGLVLLIAGISSSQKPVKLTPKQHIWFVRYQTQRRIYQLRRAYLRDVVTIMQQGGNDE